MSLGLWEPVGVGLGWWIDSRIGRRVSMAFHLNFALAARRLQDSTKTNCPLLFSGSGQFLCDWIGAVRLEDLTEDVEEEAREHHGDRQGQDPGHEHVSDRGPLQAGMVCGHGSSYAGG